MELMISLGAALTVALLVLGLRPRTADLRAHARVQELRTHPSTPRSGSPQPGVRRIGWAERGGAWLVRVLPSLLTRRVDRLVERAGSPVSTGGFLVAWFATSALATFFVVAWTALGDGAGRAVLGAWILTVVVCGPWIWLRRRAARRTKDIHRALPQALDLIVTNIECGLGLQAAMMVIGKKFEGPIGLEFARAMREIGVGVPREEALNAMAARTGSDDVAGVARAIAQAERSGVSVGEILRARARELRERRRLQARERANKVPVKMTIPTVLFIFPTFFLLLLGPIALNAVEVMAP